MYGLYIHIPFCRKKCRYCDFISFKNSEHIVEAYLHALIKEMQRYAGLPLETVYIGGGTPSLLAPRQLENLMHAVRQTFSCSALQECTMEGNPESLSAEILTAARAAGINRLSIGIQSLNDAELRTLGRLHNARDVETAVLRARNAGFSNCGVDLMYGIPAQTTASWEATLRRAIALETEHLSLYALTVEPDTPFGRDHVRTDDDVQASMYEQAIDILASEGFEHYEISNWARPGFRCRHNMVYWSNREYMGVGVAAASYFNGCRYTNTGTIEKYIDGIGRNESVVEESETIDDNLRLSEELILKLRCADGVKITDTIHNAYGAVIERLIEQGLLCRADQRLTLSRKGLFLANQVLQEFV